MGLLATLTGWWWYLLAGGVVSASVGWLVVRNQVFHVMSPVRARDIHRTPTPRLGGVAVWLGILATAFVAIANGSGIQPLQWVGILGALGVVLCVGLLDDLADLAPKWQLLGQVVAGALLGVAGVGSVYVEVPWLRELLQAGRIEWGGVPIVLGLVLLTTIWFVVIANALNWFDSVDGLAGSMGGVILLILAVLAMRSAVPGAAGLALGSAAACMGILIWNWQPARVFLGSVGPLTIGLVVAVVSLLSGAKVATTVALLAIPLIDAVVVGVRRIVRGQRPWTADQTHLPHYLRRRGWSAAQISLSIAGASGLCGILALTVQGVRGKTLLVIGLALVMGLLLAILQKLDGTVRKRVL